MPKKLWTQSSFVSSEYPTLYHYTDAGGVRGILENNTIWATHFQYLNDVQELVIGKDRILPRAIAAAKEKLRHWTHDKEMLDQMNRHGGFDLVVTHEMTNLVSAVFDTTIKVSPPYIASFSAHLGDEDTRNGSLDMWRAYSKDDGGGYAIAFETKSLEALLSEEIDRHAYYMLHMQDVSYTDSDTDEITGLTDILSDVLNGFIRRMDWATTGAMRDPEDLYQPATLELTRHKSGYFRSENEVRLVASPQTNWGSPSARSLTGRQLFHRISGGAFVPTLAVFGDDVATFRITRIIVGPGDRQEIRVSGLKSYVRQLGREIEVMGSAIPFRMV